MILQRLAEHYDRIALALSGDSESQLAPPGFSRQKVGFCIVLERNGYLNSFQSLQDANGKPQQFTLKGHGHPSGSGLSPGFLWDNSAYMLGFKAGDTDPERTIRCFEAFRERHCDLEQSIDDPAFHAVCAFLRSWSPEEAQQRTKKLNEITKSFGVFRMVGEQRFIHEIIAPNQTESNAKGDSVEPAVNGMCLLTGREGTIARLHEPAIKGVGGAKSTGAKLVSFDKSAYESYGKSQSYNAPVSIEATFKYATALNYLLDRKDRRIALGDSTVVFWADRSNHLEQAVSDLFGEQPFSKEQPSPEDRERVRQTRQLLTQLRDGIAESSAMDSESQTKFFILGLSPNAARISVRMWIEADASELEQRIGQHLRDIELFDPREEFSPSLRRIAAATGRAEFGPGGNFKKFDTEATSPQLAGDLARSVLTGAAYPQSLLAAMLGRIRSDGEIHYARVATIKACLIRNSRLRGNPSEVSVKLDLTQTKPAYNVGCLFALLETIQTDSADGDLNSTIKDRYFSSASATPALVFPRLFRLSQHHLAKLERGPRIFYEKQIGEVMANLESFPSHLSMEDQGRFVVGPILLIRRQRNPQECTQEISQFWAKRKQRLKSASI